MSFFANRSSRHAARLGPALRVTPPHWLCRTPNRHQGEQTMRAGSPFKLVLCLVLVLAIPLALAACGGGSKVSKIIPHQHWTYTHDGDYIVAQDGTFGHVTCAFLEEEVSKEKHINSSKHNPNYKTMTAVITSRNKYYPGNPGDKFCLVHWTGGPSYIQTKENEFTLQATASDSSRYRAAQIDYVALERKILFTAAALGRWGNFKYGVFDNAEERKQEAEAQVTGSTSRTTGSETGVVTPLYKSTYGVRYGNESTTTSVDRTPNSITVTRKHSVRYYNSEPDTDGYFNVDLILKSLGAEKFKVVDGIPDAKYCYLSNSECKTSFFDSPDFRH